MHYSYVNRITVFLMVASLTAPVFAASNVHRTSATVARSRTTSKLSTSKPSTTHSTAKGAKSKSTGKAGSHRSRGQQAIQSDRVTQIQEALIREHYLTGEANGNWDAATVAAMQKYQADQGWQTKLSPDSRALKKLGLGPDYSGAINARNSSFAEPPPISTIPTEQATGFSTAAGVNQ